MSNASWRHHYIPVFYLKHFTNQDGKFYIYDKKKGVFVKNKKSFAPKSFFFERDANTLITDKTQSDFLEKSYSKLESEFATAMSKLKSGIGLGPDEIVRILLFISIIYWRIPANSEKLSSLISEKSFSFLGYKIIDKNFNEKNIKEIESRLRSDPNFFKFMKLSYPLLNFNSMNPNIPVKLQEFPKGDPGLPKLCSDNPVITRQNFDNPYNTDLIMPLNPDYVLFRGNVKPIYENIRFYIDMLLYDQAIRYVSTTDPLYIKIIQDDWVPRREHVLKKYIFNISMNE